MSSSGGGFLSRVSRYARGRRGLIPLSMVVSALASVAGFVPIWLIWLVVELLFFTTPPDPEGAIRLGWWALGFTLLHIALYFGAVMLSHLAAFRIERCLRFHSVKRMLGLPLGFFENHTSGEVRKVVDDNAVLVHTFMAHQLPDLAGSLVGLLLFMVMLIGVDWRFGLVCLVPIGVAFGAMGWMMSSKHYRSAMGEYMKHLERMNGEAVEYIRGMPVVKTFQQSIFTFNRFYQTIRDYQHWVTAYSASCRVPMVIYTVSLNSFAFLLIPLTGYLIMLNPEASGLLFSTLVFYILFTPYFSTTMMRMMYLVSGRREAESALSRVDALYSDWEVPEKDSLAKEFKPSDYSISVDEVTYSYPGGLSPAVEGVTLRIEEGECIALVGASGSGKSTLARLVAGFYPLEQGRIRIGGVDISGVESEALLSRMSLVLQNEHLFKTSLRENLLFGCGAVSEERLAEVLVKTGCQEVIDRFPDGLETRIGTEGVYLSGGEAQRVILARALLRDAPIVILDEATAFLDPENAGIFDAAMAELFRGKTVILIAHRLSMVRRVDRIVVLDGGRVVEQGRHEELVDRGGAYAGLWEQYTHALSWRV